MSKNRYGVRTIVDGQTYRSQFEAMVALDLQDHGVAFEYETKTITYELPRVYTPDFVLPNGVIVEVKGYFPPEQRRKMIEVKRANPDLDIRLLFQRAQGKIGQGPRALTVAGWAEANGFPWAEGTVPPEWYRAGAKK